MAIPPPPSASYVTHLVRSGDAAAAAAVAAAREEESHHIAAAAAAILAERAAAARAHEDRLVAMGAIPSSSEYAATVMAGSHSRHPHHHPSGTKLGGRILPAGSHARHHPQGHDVASAMVRGAPKTAKPAPSGSASTAVPTAGRDDEDGIDDAASHPERDDDETPLEERIYYPRRNDVLLGRGKPFQSHYGNIRLHKFVNENRERYLGASRDEKNSIAKTIVHNIKVGTDGEPTGRFLKRAGDGRDFWLECTDVVARQKVGHALRGKPRRGEFTPRKGDVSPQAAIICDDDPRATIRKIEKAAPEDGKETTKHKPAEGSPTNTSVEASAARAKLGLVEAGRSPLLSSVPASSAAAVGGPGAAVLVDTLTGTRYRHGGLAHLHYDPYAAIHLRGPARAALPGGLSALTQLGLPISDPHGVQYLGGTSALAPSHVHLVSSRSPYASLGHYRMPPPPVARLAVPSHAPTSSSLRMATAIELERHRQEEELYRQQHLKRPLAPAAQEEERIDKRLKEDLSVAQELINLGKK